MIELTDGFQPAIGDTFEILVAGEVTGAFAEDVTLIGFPSQLDVDVSYNPGSVVIEIVPRGPDLNDDLIKLDPNHVQENHWPP